ncbi:MAG: N-acetylmuramoyl-L-alanine amidase, partial [Candidatus Magnetoovum sp. WYHC-5]|nr:N-acetylmuramoyl-L-alanine amidase [Candidatus Magnetoovum sp. WYHC-5]
MKFLKALIALIIVSLLVPAYPHGQEGSQIIMYVKDYDGFVRILLKSNADEYIQNAAISEAYSIVKIDFPGTFDLIKEQEGANVLASSRGSSLFLQISNLERIKVIKLPSPSRLVIDAYFAPVRQDTVPKEKTGIGNFNVVIDPGHGGSDSGIVSSSSQIKESALSLTVAQGLHKALGSTVKKLYLTRTIETTVPIELRIRDGVLNNPDIFVSIHMSKTNSFDIYTA